MIGWRRSTGVCIKIWLSVRHSARLFVIYYVIYVSFQRYSTLLWLFKCVCVCVFAFTLFHFTVYLGDCFKSIYRSAFLTNQLHSILLYWSVIIYLPSSLSMGFYVVSNLLFYGQMDIIFFYLIFLCFYIRVILL